MLIISILTWSLLLIATFAGNLEPSNAPTFQIITIVYPLILIFSIVLFFYWVLRRSKIAVIEIIILLVGISNLKDNFQISFDDQKTLNSDGIDILSYNVQGFSKGTIDGKINTKENVIDFLSNKNTDILLFQEFHSRSHNLYEPLKEVRDQLGMISYFYESYFSPKYDNLTGMAIYSKYEAVGKGKLKFDGSRTFGIYTDLLIHNDTVRVFNIHLASTKLSSGNLEFVTNPENIENNTIKDQSASIYGKLIHAYELREKQTNYLAEVIEKCRYKIILAGDFNDTPSSWTYKQISNKLTDAFVKKGNGFSPTYAGPIPYLRIDYIFTDEHFTIEEYGRDIIKESDHFPIYSTISVN